ncbi:hypothetical protein [Sulfolobus acidocaldarius]|uniref:VapB-type antitoxin n=4 Tax=Sulfolobus acidocaldarius TaxID=2285 RepID=Q4J7I2_SULAC|nr:hypothetical protein [Sulfolobus acidocaldarius]AAY81249.1 hypothetical protein Saci_1946 [Sulfolobus acidocaldarius DSM 639]AGE71879.1 hypothetical protein SacN8_09610 [Sulfolobus acidocaldarius N8]AGE74152.1 hypothetical protein SacRon12I_09635 [Sulfolobus acidocaldarius Ron12/I]ALU29946.1 VapB-type antitoxin [Sulfolobus acidocaldarius]ALU32689.1 VapB-type antitoxin [Sulfolobus acidocaldarius]
MIGEKFERKADEKGRIYIPEYKGKTVYLVDSGHGYFITSDKGLADAVSKNASSFVTEEFLRLVTELDLQLEDVHKEAENELAKRFLKQLS